MRGPPTAGTDEEAPEWSNGLDSSRARQRRATDARSAPEGRGAKRRVKSSVLTPDGRLHEQCGIEERCRSGRTGLTRNQVYGCTVPWVRIPPSPPVNQKRPLVGLFWFTDGGDGLEATGSTKRVSVLGAGAMLRRGGAPRIARRRFESIPPSPPKYKRPHPGPFVFSPRGLLWRRVIAQPAPHSARRCQYPDAGSVPHSTESWPPGAALLSSLRSQSMHSR